MKSKNENITTKILAKEVVDQNKVALDILDFYSRVTDIIERTHVAMGKKSTFKISSSSTKNQKLNTTAYASTY
jgi:hypothetical protein